MRKSTKRYLLLLLLSTLIITGCGMSGRDRNEPNGLAAPSNEPAQTGSTDSADATATYLPVVQGGETPAVTPVAPTPQSGHPRLWLTAADLPRLRTWATNSNPLYADGLALLAERAKAEMDEGRVPDQDCGNVGYEEYPTEMYAELFAFLSLVENDADVASDYAARARTLLMHVMNEAAKGPASEENYTCNESQQYPPFRHPDFATEDRDRIRYHGEAFPLVVDWIYPSLTAQDKATIRQVFLRWSQEVIERGYHHPEPIGLIADPLLLEDEAQVRFGGNNYFAAHMRNVGLMALALDPADDPELQLHSYLDHATGAYLYIFDHLTRTDSRGGLLPEGFEYSPQTAGYAAQLLLALHTAGVESIAGFANPTEPAANPFWSDFVPSYLHSLSPKQIEHEELGALYQPAWYGDAQVYRLSDFVSAFAPLGLLDAATGNATRLNAIRWLQVNTAPGGAERLLDRVRNPDDFRQTILYFMLLDPTAAAVSDPRLSMTTDFLAPGLNRLFARTDWSADAAWFTYALSWNSIDHQMADGNHFAFYRDGEWLTKGRTGYADIAEGIASSEFYNTTAIENDRPLDRDESDWRIDLWQRGSQWNLVSDGDPQLVASCVTDAFAYALGDATNLYNSSNEGATDVAHVSRSILWLKPDHIAVYDRLASKSTGKFKRWWLQLPAAPTITGNQALMRTIADQQLFVTSLLPADAALSSVPSADAHSEETTAGEEPMRMRLKVEAPGNPQSVRFLHLLQGADAGVTADAATLVQSGDGQYEGVIVHDTVVLFPVNLGSAPASITYDAPASVTRHIITGVAPGSYDRQTELINGAIRVTIRPGGSTTVDACGVLMAAQGQ